MAIQTVNLGTAPTGEGGDTFRSTGAKINENFTNPVHAASRYVGVAAGNVMEVGAFGVGAEYSPILSKTDNAMASCVITENSAPEGVITSGGIGLKVKNSFNYGILNIRWNGVQLVFADSGYVRSYELLHNQNATTDGNGFIKAASPISKLFADKIELNEEAQEQSPEFEKIDVGHYLIKNTEGFSDNGWYIEMPKDANGNVLVAVQYQQLEDNTIEVKTFAKKFDEETGDIVPNLEKPRDIPAGRWIDIRLKELPKPDIAISNTPPEFQPTNLEQAVSEALKDDSEQ